MRSETSNLVYPPLIDVGEDALELRLDIEEFYEVGYLTMEGDIIEGIKMPEWKYKTNRKPQSLLCSEVFVMG